MWVIMQIYNFETVHLLKTMISPSSRQEGRKAHLSLWAIGGKEKADLCATYLIIYLTKHL